MEQPLSDSNFVFCDAIDGEYIIDLYAGDYIMIQETYEDVLREYDDFIERVITTYHEGDINALKSAIHKVKPLFGFVGLTTLQTTCLQLENSCSTMTLAELASFFPSFEKSLREAKAVIESEGRRLAAFNASAS
jgi:HPt (histidine-containing phosphotransfer) domain-containing protein